MAKIFFLEVNGYDISYSSQRPIPVINIYSCLLYTSTGNLDKKNSEIVFDLFQKLAREYKQTLLIVTHDMEFAQATDHVIEMEDGRIIK